MKKSIVIRSLGIGLAVMILSGCVSRAIYRPRSEILHTPKEASLSYEEISFSSRDGVILSGWWIPAEHPRGAVLFCHGNGGNVGTSLESLVIIHELGLDLLIFDYRGYGRSGGHPSEEGTYADAEAAWEFLSDRKNVPPYRVIIWGRSLGGPIAAKTASVHPAGLVIMESTFTSLQELVKSYFPIIPRGLLADYAYDTLFYLGKVKTPVLVIHSPDDHVVPFSHGRKLFESINGPKSFLQIKGGHAGGFLESRDVYTARINDFITSHFEPQASGQ
jgi:uncharacterized protein